MSEALLFAEHGENMLCTKIVLNVRNNFWTQHVLPRLELGIFMYWTCNSISNLSSYCGLVDAKMWASDKDLPVQDRYDENLFIVRVTHLSKLMKTYNYKARYPNKYLLAWHYLPGFSKFLKCNWKGFLSKSTLLIRKHMCYS